MAFSGSTYGGKTYAGYDPTGSTPVGPAIPTTGDAVGVAYLFENVGLNLVSSNVGTAYLYENVQ